ncbi:zinc finger protein 1035 isoform X1 [Hippoglossus hippoglossus]|uniref:zinc finger protein 1035 isoform X1 n=1 Tax=Hippoglossus hippoglossus TaxID=8267 RepID=UPI00148C0262|nr:zinc finger protein 1035 isoform X1 [Hippoglossus hippoglossus]XP_034466557.1 zinc finger protein 1035 isoform X1 [Hippoglossus hippoglossus]
MQRMAHGWDSYLHNIPPLSSDPRTSEAEHLENFIEHDFTDAVDSYEAPATNSNINTNPSIENSRSDCAYQKYYEETQWQAVKEQMEKDLPSCGTGEITDFGTDGLSTSGTFPSSLEKDLQELKQDCEILATSLLEDYSDVSNCSNADVIENRPSCKFMASNSAPNSAIGVGRKHSPEWPFTDTGSMLPTESLCTDMLEINAHFPNASNVKAEENLVKCSEEKVESPEKTVKSYTGHNNISSSSSHTGANIGNEDRSDSDGCQDQKQEDDMERELILGNPPVILINGLENVTGNRIEEYPEANEEEQVTSPTPNIVTTDEVPKETMTESLNKENEELGNLNSTESQDRIMKEDKQDKSQVLKMETKESALLGIEISEEQNAPNSNSTDSQDENIQTDCKKKGIESNTCQSSETMVSKVSDLKDAIPELSECPIGQSVSKSVESCSQPNASNTQKMEQKSPAENTNATSSADQHQSQDQSLGGGVDENAGESIEEFDRSTEEDSMLGMLYGEPLSGEDSSSDDETKLATSKITVARPDSYNMDHSEGQTVQLTSSRQLRKHLQPIVILEPLESVNGMSKSYRCRDCQHTTPSVDHQFEHHHGCHSVPDFQFCGTCNLYFMRNEQAEKHLCGVTKKFPQLSSDSRLQKKVKHHGRHRCIKCKLRFSKFVQYISHMRTHTGETPYKCNECGTYFAQGGTLRRHNKISGRCSRARRRISKSAETPKTKTPPQKQLVQNKPYTNLPNCYVKLVDIAKTNLCRLCGKSFVSAKKAKKHFYNLHKGKGLTVSLNQCTTKPIGEKTQKAENEISKKYKCPLCPRLFKYSYNRARHLRDCVRDSVWNGKGKVGNKYPCPLCHTIFTSPSNRFRHIRQAVCLKECLSRLAIERAKLFQEVEQKKGGKETGTEQKTQSNENKDKTLSKENEQKKEKTHATKAFQPALRYKCNLCPAVFCHSSGKYRHMKKHELFKLTGKMFRYRNSFFSSMSKPETLRSTQAEEREDGLTSIEENVTLSLSCTFCGKYFGTSQSLKSHERNHRGERPYCCLECGKGFKKRTHLICHKAVHQRRIQCTVCKKILPTIGELIQHRSSHLKKGKLQCPDCDLQFEFPVYLLRHLETHRNKEKKASQLEERPSVQLQCSLCKKTFDDAQVLRKHCLTHITRSSSNQCPFCKRRFACRRNLLRHMVQHTGEKTLSCRNCGKLFLSDLYLKRHSQECFPPQTGPPESNTETKRPFKCSYCPREFSRKIRLKGHQQGHKTNTLVLCSRCGESYGRTKINQHQKKCGVPTELNTDSLSNDFSRGTSQTNQSVHDRLLQSNASKLHQFKCPHCKENFRYRSVLLRHLFKHTGVQPYGCVHCGHGYRSKTMCLQHETLCTGVYKEGLSNVKSNAVANSLTMPALRVGAQRRAEGENEYKCRFCTKTFMKPRNLRRHILTHNEVNPYRCKACDSCFSRHDHLKVHQTRCRGKKQRLEVCIPKISLEDVGKGWQNRFGTEPSETQEIFKCKVCSRSFPNQSKLFRHNQMFHLAKLFKCTRCGSSFAHETSLKKHQKKKRCKKVPTETNASPPLRTNPTENVKELFQGSRNRIIQRIQPCFNKKYKYVCSFCPRTFENSWQLSVHNRLHTGEKPFACDYCGERFIRKDYVQRHLPKCTKMGKQKKLLCDKCGGFFSKANIENHKTNCTTKPSLSKATVCQSKQSSSQSPPKGFSCAYCSSRFLLFSQLQEHFLNAHKLETVVPPASTAPLQHHLSNIPKIKEEPLDETCDQKLNDSAKFTCKLDSALNRGFVCPVCNMSLVNKAGLTGHLRVHSMEHPFSCKICKKGFWNRSLLRSHFRKCRSGHIAESKATQQMEVPLKAQIDFALDDSVLVFKEASTATGSGVLQTNFSCKEEFIEKSPQDLDGNQVQSSSSKEKKAVQYQCSECDKSFTDGLLLISHLEDHGRKEQEKKRNTCSKCGRVCSNPGNLTRHMLIHETNHNFSCPDCPQIFFTAADLEIHRTCHDSNRPYACKLCNLRFWTRPSLSNHCSEDHPVDVFSCRFCHKKYSVKKSLSRHYRKWHQKEQKELASTLQEKSSTEPQSSNQVSTADESDEDEKNGSEDSDSDSAPYFPCHVCGKTFPTSESLEDHQRCHLGEKPHECEECGRCFFQASQLQQHQRMHKSEFQCQACGRGFVSLFALRKHKHTHGKSRPYRCAKCDCSFTGPSQLAEHMTTHREESFPCDICNRVFLSKSSRAEHRKSHSKSGDHPPPSFARAKQESSTSPSESSSVFTKEFKYRCGVCNERFKDPEQLSEHGCLAAKERPYACSDCDKYYLHASHLKKHRNTHHLSLSKSEYPCNQCNSSFSSSQHFLSHLKTHVDPAAAIKRNAEGKDKDSFICPVCHQSFTSAIELIGHFPIHLDSTFECKICKMKFPSGRKLEEHEQTHLTAATEFECTECGQRFLGSNTFLQHHCSQQQHGMKESNYSNPSVQATPPTYQPAAEEEEVDVTGEDLFNCPHCSMQFSSKSVLLEHQNKIHLKERPFKCEICGKTFAVQRYLREHLRRHGLKLAAAQKRFACTQCQSEFSTAQDLYLHRRLHAEKEVGGFRCDMCYKSFSRWSLLKQHQESHVGEVVYECTECDKAFAFPHLLVEHQQTHAGPSQ